MRQALGLVDTEALIACFFRTSEFGVMRQRFMTGHDMCYDIGLFVVLLLRPFGHDTLASAFMFHVVVLRG